MQVRKRLVLAAAAGLVLGAGGVSLLSLPEPAARRARALRVEPGPVGRAERPPVAPVAQGAPGARGDDDARTAAGAACIGGRQILFAPDEPRRPGSPSEAARALLAERRRDLGLDAMPGELVLVREFDSLSAHHLRMRQTLGGVPVEGSEVSAHVTLDGRPLLLLADVHPLDGVPVPPPAPSVSADEAVRAGLDLVGAAFEADEEEDDPGPEGVAGAPLLVVRPDGRSGRLAWRVDVRTPTESTRVWVDAADGEVLAAADLRRTADGQGAVFVPNPVFSAKDGALRDSRDADSAALTSARAQVTLRRLDGSGRLVGSWVDTSDSRGSPVRIGTLDWTDLVRSQDGFEAANAYHHVDRTQDRLQSLGFTDVNAEPQRVDAHGTSADQSFYDISNDQIFLGDGGVDDGEDGDIVVHEYGHAIQDAQVPGFGSTNEGRAMGEGFSDYLAATLHATGDPVWDPLVGSWDATSYSRADPPFLRRVDLGKVYPRDLEGEAHSDGEIWSRFLWDLNGILGADEGLRLVIESHSFLSSNARFLQGANAVLVANASLRAGADDAEIRAAMRDRGLPYSEPPVNAPPEDSFEENDFWNDSATILLGDHPDLLLADDDWYRVSVAPFRRLIARATFDAVEMDLDLELATAQSLRVERSQEVTGIESVSGSAGLGGATFLVHAYKAPKSVRSAGYSLLLVETSLEALQPGRTDLLAAAEQTRSAYAVDVPPEKAGSKLVVRSRAKGRRGAVNDLRLVSPSGDVLVDFGAGRRSDGARVVATGVEAGAWTVEVAPRGGSGGRYAIRAVFKP